MQPHIIPTEDIAGIYRFAVLLAGAPEAAQSAVLQVLADNGGKIDHFRTGKSCKAWLVAEVRRRLLKNPAGNAPEAAPEAAPETAPEKTETAPPAEPPSPAALDLAARFSRLPEPGRSALALLYINHFSLQEIAQILQLPPEKLPGAIDSARVLLQKDAPAPAEPGEEAQP